MKKKCIRCDSLGTHLLEMIVSLIQHWSEQINRHPDNYKEPDSLADALQRYVMCINQNASLICAQFQRKELPTAVSSQFQE